MFSSVACSVRTMPDWRAAWQCSPSGFVAVSPVCGSRAVLAVGEVAPQIGPSSPGPGSLDATRERMRAVIDDRAMVDGHEPTELFHRVNATLATLGIGRIHSLALLSTAGDQVPPAIAGVGRPLPLIVTPGGLGAPVEGTVSLGPGWGVVVGAPSAGSWPESGLLAPADVATAMSLFTRSFVPGVPFPSRTLLAVVIDG